MDLDRLNFKRVDFILLFCRIGLLRWASSCSKLTYSVWALSTFIWTSLDFLLWASALNNVGNVAGGGAGAGCSSAGGCGHF